MAMENGRQVPTRPQDIDATTSPEKVARPSRMIVSMT